MERINQFEFYELGETLQQIKDLTGDINGGDAFLVIYGAHRAVDALVDGKPLELTISKVCATRLRDALWKFLNDHFRKDGEDGKRQWSFPSSEAAPIPAWLWSESSRALTEFETIFREEMREAATYRVPDRGIFNTAKLVDAADQSFPSELTPFISAKTRADWKAAGRCLAFNLLSASGFHVARAVEAMLEIYYQAATGKMNTLKGWADYIKALEKAAIDRPETLVPSTKVTSALSQMKDDYRNPIVHPRVVLSDADSRMLFANGESLIIAMAQEIQAARSAPAGLTGVLAEALTSARST